MLVVGRRRAGPGRHSRPRGGVGAGPSFERGALRSASTRRAPYVQLVDVAPTVLALLGVPVPAVMDGQPWQVRGPAPSVGRARGAVRARDHRPSGHGAVLRRARRRPAGAARRTAPPPGGAARSPRWAARPPSARRTPRSSSPWWRSPAPLLTLLAVVAALSRRPPPCCARSVGAGVRARRRCCSSSTCSPARRCRWTRSPATRRWSPAASPGSATSPSASRHGGPAGGGLRCRTPAARGRQPPRSPSLGTVAVVVAGRRGAATSAGCWRWCPPSRCSACCVSGARVTAARLALAAGRGRRRRHGLRAARPRPAAADRTHLGRFAADVRDGTAGDLLRRKAEAVLDLLLANPVTAAAAAGGRPAAV